MTVHVTERQLHLFKSRRQKGSALPAPSEYQLHCAVVDTIRRWIMPGWIYTHIASGERRDQITAARFDPFRAAWGSLRHRAQDNGRSSEAQAAMKRHFEQAGHGYLCSSDYRDVIKKLKDWGVLRSGISVQ